MDDYKDSPEQRRGQADRQYITKYAWELAYDYDRQWIAVWGFQVIDHDTDVRTLWKRIDFEKYPNPVIRFIDKTLI